MSDKDTVQLSILVDEHLRDAAQDATDHGELSERVRDLCRSIAFGEEIEERESLKRELQRVRDKKDETRVEIRELQNDLQALESKEARLEERVSSYEDDEQRYIGHLESLESCLYDGVNLAEGDARVKQAANAGSCGESEVIEELKERNPEIPEHAFKKAIHSTEDWDGVQGRILE